MAKSAGAPTPIVLPATQPGDIGRAAPSTLVAASPTGHWAVLCQALDDTDGNGQLEVRLSEHGEFEGDTLLPALFVGQKQTDIDEYAGSDPSGRFVAYVLNRALWLLDTLSGEANELQDADVRADLAPFLPLRSVTFSDDGKYVAYIRGPDNASKVVLRELATRAEHVLFVGDGLLARIRFAAGGRFLELDVVTEDTNENRRLQWPYPQRKDAVACPSPVPNYSVWQYPGDKPTTQLIDTSTREIRKPEGFLVAAGNVYVRRDDDQRLLAVEPGKPTRIVSSAECAGRVMHVDIPSGNVLFGCATGWGQRRDLFLRTATARKKLDFDLAGFELDSRLDTTEPSIALYPRNESLIYNLRTRERWSLLDGTPVLALVGTTALLERSEKLVVVKLNPDASVRDLTQPVPRPPLATLLTSGPWVAVGPLLFDLEHGKMRGSFPSVSGAFRAPDALSTSGEGLFPSQVASPSRVGYGPFRWRTAQ